MESWVELLAHYLATCEYRFLSGRRVDPVGTRSPPRFHASREHIDNKAIYADQVASTARNAPGQPEED